MFLISLFLQPITIDFPEERELGNFGGSRLGCTLPFVTVKRLVCKNGHSLVEPPSRVFYTVSVSACLFAGERFFQKVYGRPLLSPSAIHTFRTVTETEPQVVVLFRKR